VVGDCDDVRVSGNFGSQWDQHKPQWPPQILKNNRGNDRASAFFSVFSHRAQTHMQSLPTEHVTTTDQRLRRTSISIEVVAAVGSHRHVLDVTEIPCHPQQQRQLGVEQRSQRHLTCKHASESNRTCKRVNQHPNAPCLPGLTAFGATSSV
jgi:hypothetical protein